MKGHVVKIGERFGKLTITGSTQPKYYNYTNKNGINRIIKKTKWKCRCDCGNEIVALQEALNRGKKKSCGCMQKPGPTHHGWIGYGEISGHQWNDFRWNAFKRKHKDFLITIKYAWNLFLKQNRRCALSGLPIQFDSKWRAEDGNASLDRIDNNKGYIEGNVQWIHKDVNSMKMDLDQNEFFELCHLVVINNKY